MNADALLISLNLNYAACHAGRENIVGANKTLNKGRSSRVRKEVV